MHRQQLLQGRSNHTTINPAEQIREHVSKLTMDELRTILYDAWLTTAYNVSEHTVKEIEACIASDIKPATKKLSKELEIEEDEEV